MQLIIQCTHRAIESLLGSFISMMSLVCMNNEIIDHVISYSGLLAMFFLVHYTKN